MHKKKKHIDRINKIGCNKYSYLSKKDIKNINIKKKEYKCCNAIIIEVLKIIQNRYGWVSNGAIKDIAKILKINRTEIDSIATFYSQIFRQKIGKNIIKYCDGIVCYINNYKDIKKEINRLININSGETTLDKNFTLIPISCLGLCDKSPIIMINEDIYMNISINYIYNILEKYK